jgi:MATE family multidrug resistance protein
MPADRPSELRALMEMAVPIALVQFGGMLMGTVDTMMVGRLSDAAIAAVALGNAVTLTVLWAGVGVLVSLSTLCAQAAGAGRPETVTASLQQGIVLALLLAVPISLVAWNLEPLLRLLKQQEAIVPLSGGYARGIVPGILGALLYNGLRQSLQGLGVVRPLLAAVAVGNLVNIAANYCLIFGNFGFPRLEVVGSALATSLSRWCMLATLIWVTRDTLARYWVGMDRRALELAGHLRILRVGAPIGIQISLEFAVFTTVALMMGNLGVTELAGHQVALSLASLSFMLPLSVAQAATARVGHAIGEGDMPRARRSVLLSFALGMGIMLVSAAIFAFFPRPLARLFTPELGVIEMAATLLPIAAVFQLADGAQVVGAGVLRGAADTKLPALIALIGYWGLALPVGWFLSRHTALGAPGLWWGLTAGLAVVALLYGARIHLRFRGQIQAVI